MARNTFLVPLAMTVATLLAPDIRAQEQPINSIAKNKAAASAATSEIKGGAAGGDVPGGFLGVAPAPAKVTPQTLAEFLRKLGFAPKEVTPTIGVKYCI